MDYKKLLLAYMQFIRNSEGTDMLGCASWTQWKDYFPTLTEDELQHLVDDIAACDEEIE